MGFLPPSAEHVVASVIRQLDQHYGNGVRAGLATAQALAVNAVDSLERIADSLDTNACTTRHLAAAQWVMLAAVASIEGLDPGELTELLTTMGLPPEEVAIIGFGPKRHPETDE